MSRSGPPPLPFVKRRDAQRQSLAARALDRTKAKQAAFLAALEERGTVRSACIEARVGRRTIYDWAAHDARFADAFAIAREGAAEIIEDEVRRRGVDGVAEPVFYQGSVVAHVRKYSDACLLALLSAYRPERFGRRRSEKPSDASREAVVQVSYDFNMKPDV
jgi:hypothetical protein